MSIASERRHLTLLALWITFGTALPASAQDVPPLAVPQFMRLQSAKPDDVRRVALVTSGAISLGAYEAGVNWVLVRYIRTQHERGGGRIAFPEFRSMQLTAATGASAGNINALLSVAAYCAADAEPSSNNLFYDTWAPIGLPELTDEANYLAEDGLLGRRKIEEKARNVMTYLSSARFDACRVPMGITLTPVDPDVEHFGSLRIPHERNAVLLRAIASNGGALQLRPLEEKSTPPGCTPDSLCDMQQRFYRGAVGRVVTLPYNANLTLNVESVTAAIEASAAVQFVFGAKAVTVCRSDSTPGAPCVGGGTQRAEYFTDGGFFDNTPLGLAIALGSTRLDQQATDEYIYIDPSNLDPAVAPPEKTKGVGRQLHPHSLSRLGTLAAHLLTGAREYELATVSRYFEAYGAHVYGTMRMHPVIGSHLSAFGAFTSRVFRQYDYDAGIADGLYFTASRICGLSEDGRPDSRGGWHVGAPPATCMVPVLRELVDLSGLARCTHPDQCDEALIVALINRVLQRRGMPPIVCAELPVPDANAAPVLFALDDALRNTAAADASRKESEPVTLWDEVIDGDGFGNILEYLAKHDFERLIDACRADYCGNSAEKALMKDWLDDPAAELRRLADHLSMRQLTIERGDSGDPRFADGDPRPVNVVRGLLRQEQLIAGIRQGNGGSALGWWNAAPYSISVDAARGGVDIAYRKYFDWPLQHWVGLVPQFGVLARPQSLRSGVLHIDGLLSVKTSRKSFFGPTLEGGAQVRQAFTGRLQPHVGPEAGVSFFAEKLHLTAAYFPANKTFMALVGVGDFPGLFELGLER